MHVWFVSDSERMVAWDSGASSGIVQLFKAVSPQFAFGVAPTSGSLQGTIHVYDTIGDLGFESIGSARLPTPGSSFNDGTNMTFSFIHGAYVDSDIDSWHPGNRSNSMCMYDFESDRTSFEDIACVSEAHPTIVPAGALPVHPWAPAGDVGIAVRGHSAERFVDVTGGGLVFNDGSRLRYADGEHAPLLLPDIGQVGVQDAVLLGGRYLCLQMTQALPSVGREPVMVDLMSGAYQIADIRSGSQDSFPSGLRPLKDRYCMF